MDHLTFPDLLPADEWIAHEFIDAVIRYPVTESKGKGDRAAATVSDEASRCADCGDCFG
jgi:hypothetical protein